MNLAASTAQQLPTYLERARSCEARYPIYELLNKYSTQKKGPSRAFVTVLEFTTTSVKDIPFSNVNSLKKYLKQSPAQSTGYKGRLFLLEDPSLELVDALGSALNIDPGVFASYVYTPNRSEPGHHKVARMLPSKQAVNQAYGLRYHEILDMGKDAPTVEKCSIATSGNVPRSISTFQFDAVGTEKPVVTGSVRRNMCFWYNTDKTSATWDGEYRTES
jgi:hypothetical protein